MKSEFTRDSIRKFASLYFGVKLDLYGSITVDEDTQDEIMNSLRQAVAKRQQVYKEKIRKDIIKAINNNIIDGKVSTGVNIDDLIKKLDDPHSSHLTENDSRALQQQLLDGSISGIGVWVSKTTESYITIGKIFTDSPAIDAGIQINDRIIKIENHTITAEDKLENLISQIQWPEGTSVSLTFQRWDEIFTKTIIRKKIVIDPITIKKLNNDKVLMSIDIFQVGIYNIFTKNIKNIITYPTIVIDLRNNGGGSLDDTRAMLDHIVPQDAPIYHTVSNGIQTSLLSQWIDSTLSLEDKKIIFLTNKYTASASEIFAGVTREYDENSHIIGEQSYGKWSIQTLRTFTDGTLWKATTAHRLLGKSKKSIEGIGLTPDYAIIDNPLTLQDEVLDYVINNM